MRIGGGARTIQQYLRTRLLDELNLGLRPIRMGSGKHLFAGVDLAALGYFRRNSFARNTQRM